MKTIHEWLREFMDAMINELEKHNDHPEYNGDFNIDGLFEDLRHTDIETLRYEKHTHYAKWMYNGVHKKTYPEADTIVNDANVDFLLWVRLKIMEKEQEKVKQ
ncbi:MAG: hypothetical protein QXU18_04610 [Thermoplasmatales archaeon]